MSHGIRRASARPHDDDQAPVRLRKWLEKNDDLMAGLVRLRDLPFSARAVRAVLTVPEVATIRLSWALWEALVTGDGDDPDRLLLGRVPLAMLDQARLALWGESFAAPYGHLAVIENE